MTWTHALAQSNRMTRRFPGGEPHSFIVPREGMPLGADAHYVAVGGHVLWSDGDGEAALAALVAMVPQAHGLVVPVLGRRSSDAPLPGEGPELRIVGRTGYHKVDSCVSPSADIVVVSLSATVTPLHLARNEAWRVAERTLFTPEEIGTVVRSHARAITLADKSGLPVERDTSAWAARCFAGWAAMYDLSVGQYRAKADDLHALSHGLLYGMMATRVPRRMDVDTHREGMTRARDGYLGVFRANPAALHHVETAPGAVRH